MTFFEIIYITYRFIANKLLVRREKLKSFKNYKRTILRHIICFSYSFNISTEFEVAPEIVETFFFTKNKSSKFWFKHLKVQIDLKKNGLYANNSFVSSYFWNLSEWKTIKAWFSRHVVHFRDEFTIMVRTFNKLRIFCGKFANSRYCCDHRQHVHQLHIHNDVRKLYIIGNEKIPNTKRYRWHRTLRNRT